MPKVTEIGIVGDLLDPPSDTPLDPLDVEGPQSAPESHYEPMADVEKPEKRKPAPESAKALRFPTPKYRIFNSDYDNTEQRPGAAFRWMDRQPQWVKDRADWYVYRDHPVLISAPLNADTKRPEWFKYIDKFPASEPNPIIEELDLLNRYGAGKYHLILNETGVEKGKEGRTILTVYVQNLGGGDFRAHPPNDQLISDVNKVDTSHPNNRAYLTYLSSIGKLPEQVNAEKEKQEMATATVVDRLMEGNEKLMDRMSKMADKAAATPLPPTPIKPDESITTARGLLDAAGETMAKASEMVMEKARGLGLEDVLNVADRITQGKNAAQDQVDKLTGRLLDMQAQQIDALNRRLDAMANNAPNHAQSGPAAAPADPFAFFDRGVEALEKMKNTADRLGSGGRVADEAVDSAGGPAWLKTAAAAMPFVAQIFSGAVRAYELSRMAPGTVPPQPMQPMAPMQQEAPVYNPSPAPGSTSTPALTSLPAASPTPSPTSPSGLNVPALIYMIQAPLLNHLNMPELSGADFADWFIGGYGLEVFSQVKEFGPFLEATLREHTIETANGNVKPFNEIPRLGQFVGEFLAFDPNKED